MRAHLALVLVLLVLPSLPADAARVVVRVPLAHVGDRAAYVVEGADASLAFAWAGPEATYDRWGEPVQADVLHVLNASTANPTLDTNWTETREAYDGHAGPVWRATTGNRSDTLNDSYAPGVFSLSSAYNGTVTTTDYAPAGTLRACLARHDLLGAQLEPGVAVPFATLCPAVHADAPQPATGRLIKFLGRDAVEFSYDLTLARVAGDGLPDPTLWRTDSVAGVNLGSTTASHSQPWTPGNAEPAWTGTLTLTLADGLPWVAQATVRGAGESAVTHIRLAGIVEGNGPVVPAGNADTAEHLAEAAQQPLSAFGPRDGGSGLAFPLEASVAAVQQDATLTDYQAWRSDHPAAFLLEAGMSLTPAPPNGRVPGFLEQTWDIVFASPVKATTMEVFDVTSTLDQQQLPGLPAQRVVRNQDKPDLPLTPFPLGAWSRNGAIASPVGRPAIDFAHAFAAWRAHPLLLRARLSEVGYTAGVDGQPAAIVLGGPQPAASSQDAARVEAAFDITSGALARLRTYYDHQQDAQVHLDPAAFRAAVTHIGQGFQEDDVSTLGAWPAGVRALDVLAVTVVAALLALLAQGGVLTVAYSRLVKSDLLQHQARQDLYALVRAQPGIHFMALVGAGGYGMGTTGYHLRVLRRAGLLTEVVQAHYKRFYLTGSMPAGAMKAHAELARPSSRALYDLLRQNPGLTVGEAARRLRVTTPAVSQTAQRLREAGLLDKVVEGRSVRMTVRAVGVE